ncbi:uncharacterized protein PRCAT00004846001 [Priceomyces carsonii]|uniref:uncharacterized protein n=1 Tax=Priceomyces carsonii TaxID=28549 RepID=UPI002ED8B8CF|nr:unnamed protein product [Priceomyces carsonii]
MLPAGGRRSKIRPPRKSLIASSVGGAGSDAALDYEKAWLVLSNAINQIQSKNVSNLSYEQLYRKAYILVLRKFGARLYDNVASSITQHLLQRRTELLKFSNDSEEFMKQTIVEWEEHMQSMKFISDVLMYLNRVYVREHKKLLIYDLGIQLFKDNILKYNDNEVGSKLIEMVIDEISRNRKGEFITTKIYITKIINMFEMLTESGPTDIQYGENYYQRYFELAFLSSSETFFYKLSQEYLNYGLGARYLMDTYQFIKDEEKRVNFYLPSSTYPKLIELMNNIMIIDKIDQVICFPLEQKGLSYLLEPVLSNIFEMKPIEHHYNELRTLYELIGRVDPDYKLLRMRLREQIINQGTRMPILVKESLASSSANTAKKASASLTAFAIKWIESVLEYQNQFSLILKESFNREFVLEECVSTAMRDFITGNPGTKRPNSNPGAPELLSIYMDHYIKQFQKSSNEVNIDLSSRDEFLNKSISFLRFIRDKDAFEAHYANHFAKRFLNAKAGNSKLEGSKLSDDLEELVISRLCDELGTSALEKVIKMNKDIKLSNDLTREWRKHSIKSKKDYLVDLELKICNVSDWPKSMTKDYKGFSNDLGSDGFLWPRQLRPTIKEFEEFWFSGKKNDNKSLYWFPRFGSMDLRITYPSRTYEINMSTYAGVIMLLFAPQSIKSDGSQVTAFEELKEFSFLEIKELTHIPDADLRRQLQSIAVAPRLRLLIKYPMTKEVNDGDIFKLNADFKSTSPKVKVLTVSASSTSKGADSKKTHEDENQEEVQSDITEGRKFVVNAAIVRIMKSRHDISHNDLISELVKQLSNRFQPLISLIKQRIEDLIDKEYLKRDDDDKSIYHYVA